MKNFLIRTVAPKLKLLEVQRELNTLHIVDRLSDPELKFQKKYIKSK